MVFKRVLKGIGRLMLTTAVMCGVGLFLCSSEVKAAVADPTVEFAQTTLTGIDDVRFSVTVTNNNTDPSARGKTITVTQIKLSASGQEIASFGYSDEVLGKQNGSEDNKKIFQITNSDFINAVNESNITTGLGVTFDTVEVRYDVENGSTGNNATESGLSATSLPIYKVDVTKVDTGVSFDPTFSYKVGGRDMQYGYEGESYTVTPKKDDFDINNYFDLVKESASFSLNLEDTGWRPANTISGKIKGTQSENEFKVAYLPDIEELKITEPISGRLDKTTTGVAPIYHTVKYQIGKIAGDDKETSSPDLSKYKLIASVPSYTNLSTFGATTEGKPSGECEVSMSLSNTDTSGSGTARISAILGNYEVAHVDLPVSLSIKATSFKLQSETVSLMAGVEQQIDIIKGITPAGANQNLENYTGSATVTSGNNLIETCTYNNTGGNKTVGTITLKTSSGVTSGTATVQIKLKDKTTLTDLDPKILTVKIISFDKEKTISSINKNNKNYITYNKDKGYSLDIKQLIIDNAKDTSDNAVTITKDQITDVYVGSSSCTDGIWKPSEAAINKEVKCKVNDVQIDGIKVSAYPMPTATYSSSNRTLSVKIPTKVATAYSDDNNIRQSKGFKLILEDSSGNTLYEYTDSKYQNVLSSSSESTVTYTVPAADIEGMITSAASNGKFSADTTSVKFKVIPMGYKQSSTSDETIKAKDEIAGKTDAVTVYKVSASGTNFTSSAAYGLDGQTVSITATPNSGYSFKQWSDGNTSNPRQVKVSASGTRAFQAVAGDRVANSTGAGGTDNSELYDDVPKTAESNSAIWLIVFMVFAVMGTTYALYLQLRAANSKHDR